jgi:hypothetical protein
MRNVMLALAISALTALLASPVSAQPRAEMREMSVWPICLTAGEESSTRCEFATQYRPLTY